MMESMQQEIEASEPGTSLKITEDSRKVDSGMDEGSNSSQDLGDNSEDEDIVSVKPKKKVHRIFDDESEDSRDVSDATFGQGNSRPTKKELKTAEEVLDEVLNSSSSDESDAEKISLAASLKKKKIRRRKMSEDSSEEDGEALSSVIKNNMKGTMSDIFDAEEDNENEGNTQTSSRQSSQSLTNAGKDSDADEESEEDDSEAKGTNSELTQKEGRKSPLLNKKKRKSVSPKKTTKDSKFGTGGNFKSKEFIEDSSSEDEGGDKKLKIVTELPDNFLEKEEESNHSSSDSDQSSKHNSDGDEGFDESTIDPALLKKLKQGAAKKEKSGRKSALSKAQDEKMQIHSESQRMVRESRVSLPYHQPAPRSLNDFLARANKKQQEYKVLKGARDFTKAKLLQDVLQRTKLPAAQALPQDNDSDDDWTPEDDGMKKLKDRLDERLKGKKENDESMAANTRETNGAEKIESSQHEAMNEDSDNDSLPDIDKYNSPKTDDKVILDQEDGEFFSHSNSVKETEPIEKETNAVNETDSNTEKNVDSVISETDSIKRTDSVEMEIDNDNRVGSSDKTENDITSVDRETSKLDESEGECEIVSKESCKQTSDIECKDQCAENDENVDPNKLKASNTQNEKSENETKDLTSILEKKKNRLSALTSIDLTNVRPCLSGNSDAFICLEEKEPAPADPGLVKLMDRLCQHSAKREKKHPKDLDISIVQKDKTSIDREELKLNTFTYHTEEEKENPLLKLETPGAKLMALKEQLKAKMKEKREQARQQRQEMYDLDNEEGGFDVEEEEAEMSDRSDTDVEDEEADDEEFDGEEEEEDDGNLEEDNGEEEEKETNPFADDEAAEEDEGDNDISDDDDDEMNLKLDISDEESESEDQPPTVTSLKKKITQSLSIDESDTTDTNVSEQKEEHTANTAFKEPSEKVLEKPFSMFGSKSKESMVIDTQIQSGQRSFSLTFPEESQDLYGNSTLPELGPTQYKQTQESQKLNFYLEDSQSNMLDADGYLRVKSTAKKPAKPVDLEDASESQDQMDDLLNLCSGRFTGISQSKDKASRKSLFDEVKDTQGNIDELMGLCSGVFGESAQQGTQKKGVKRKVSVEEQEDEDSIEAFSDDERNDEDKEDFINDDLDNDEESDKEGEPADLNSEEEEDNDDDGEEKLKSFTGFTVQNKHGKIRQEFVDAEAELSGSEAESDEDLDLAEDDDIMEIEEGDKDAIANNDQLRDEVGRVHLKQLIDEDKRELMRFQEMYLPDGDLHSEGGGRMRRFRWNNNDDTQQDMFDNDSDGEHVEEENDTDFKWRKERFEREQFIQELQEKEQEDSEASQFMKFGKIFLKKQGSLDKTVTADKAKTNPTAPAKESPSSFYKLSKQKRGSFLARSKEALAKIAEMTKPVANPSAGAKSSGKFTFAVISPEKESQQADTMEKPKRQARTDKSKSKDTPAVKPPAKKQKLDTESSFTQNSVFHHL